MSSSLQQISCSKTAKKKNHHHHRKQQRRCIRGMLLLPFNATEIVSLSLFLLLLLLSMLTNIGSTSRLYAAASTHTTSETTRRQQRRVRGADGSNNGIEYRNSIFKDNNNSKSRRQQQQQLRLQRDELPDSRSLGLGGVAEEILFQEDVYLFNGDDNDTPVGGGGPNGGDPPRKHTARPKGEDNVTNAVVDGYKKTTLAPKAKPNTNPNGTNSSTSSNSNDSEMDNSSSNVNVNINDNDMNNSSSNVKINNEDNEMDNSSSNVNISNNDNGTGNPWNDPQSSLSPIMAPTIPAGGDGNTNTNGSIDGIGGSSGNGKGVEEIYTNGDSGEAKDLVCLSISLQEPITSPEIEALTTTVFFSISIDVEYHTDIITSSTEIENFLDETNPAVAYWIAGCGKESESNGADANADANAILATDKSVRRTRGLQQGDEQAAHVVTYAELEHWSNTETGPCDGVSNESGTSTSYNDEDTSVDQLLASTSSTVCNQQSFASRIQIRVKRANDDREASFTSEYLSNQIAKAFDTILKPLLEAQPGVISVELGDVNKETEIALQDSKINEININGNTVASNESKNAEQGRRRRIAIIACSVTAATIIMCILLTVLTCTFRRRQKKLPLGGYNNYYSKYFSARRDRVDHVPLEDELTVLGANNDDVEGYNKDHDLIVDSIHLIAPHEDKSVTTTTTTTTTPMQNRNYVRGPSDELDFDTDGVIPCPFETRSYTSASAFDQEGTHYKDVCSSPTCKHCERRRQLGITVVNRPSRSFKVKSIQPREPPKIPMNRMSNALTAPRNQRLPLHMSPDTSDRTYMHDDFVVL